MNQNTEPLPEIKITKVMREKMARYGVELRTGPSTIRHLAYGKETTVSPSVHAMYEIAIKANYVSWFLHHSPIDNTAERLAAPEEKEQAKELIGLMGYYGAICDQSTPKIARLPHITDEMVKHKDKEGPQASTDYHWAAKHISDVGLYHDLLD